MGWEFAHGSDIGGRSEQQDSYSILDHMGNYLLVLADGMGGREQGAMASDTVIETAHTRFYSPHRAHPEQFLKRLCMEAHRKILKLGRNNGTSSGSTAIFLYLQDNEAYWAHVGDSRLYHFHNDKLLFHTKDHSMLALQQQNSEFGNSAESNQLYMCLGGDNDVVPEINAAGLNNDDLFLLCSDGFWSEISPDEILRQLALPGTLQYHTDMLIRTASERGGKNADNISLLIARHQTRKRLPGLLKLVFRK
ncbi:PP2C family protein-serine/threonine phosphatase [Thiolapillus sp.]